MGPDGGFDIADKVRTQKNITAQAKRYVGHQVIVN